MNFFPTFQLPGYFSRPKHALCNGGSLSVEANISKSSVSSFYLKDERIFQNPIPILSESSGSSVF